MDRATASLPPATTTTPKRLNVFGRYLSLWSLCMIVGTREEEGDHHRAGSRG